MAYLFLSYAKADRETALAMREALQYDGIVVWMDENINALEDWRWPRIEKIIQESGGFVLLVSDAVKQSACVNRELSYAEKIDKPIFPILIQGEGWSRLTMETAKLGLGMKLDLPDDFSAKMEKISKDVYEKPFPPQIPIENKAAQRQKSLVALISITIALVVLYRLSIFFLETSANLDAEATGVVMTRRSDAANTQVFQGTRTQIQREIQEERTRIAATIEYQENIAATDLADIVTATPMLSFEELMATATALFSPLPCGASIIESDSDTFPLYSRPSFESEVSVSVATNGGTLRLTVSALMTNNEGRWYYVRVVDSSYAGYVPDEAVQLDRDCPD